jgi:tRNA pseudouridine38-40 synthase
MRLALGIEYDGGAFCGWQIQPDQPTVQGALEAALAAVAQEPIGVICAGRTDTGVHATAQVVHFDTAVVRPDTAWVRGVNAHLPPGVAVLWAKPVAQDFHARFSATARSYTYCLLTHPVRPALLSGKIGWYHQTLDLDAMQKALALLLGQHDFSAFRAAECQAKTPVKTLREATLVEHRGMLFFRFSADAFLHHMIRNIMGAMVWVGSGRQPPQWIEWLLEQRNRTLGPPTFMADGLYLTAVDYDQSWQLPADNRHGELLQQLCGSFDSPRIQHP